MDDSIIVCEFPSRYRLPLNFQVGLQLQCVGLILECLDLIANVLQIFPPSF